MCLYWVGAFRGRDFTTKDVVRLRETVDKWIDRPYDFYCLTNDMDADVPAIKIQLEYAWPGWWSKIELHRADLPPGRTLYLDLDTHVISNLSPILNYPGNLVMFRTRVSRYRRLRPEKGVIPRYQAGIMLFTPGKFIWLYDKFRKSSHKYMRQFRSDQDLMGSWIPNQPTFPNEWMYKLSTCLNTDTPPANTIIVTGQPRDVDFRDPKSIPWLKSVARGKEEE